MSSSTRKFVGSIKLLAAFVAGMLAFGANAGDYLMTGEDCHGPNYIDLPAGVKLVEYIKSTSANQRIDLGVVPVTGKTSLDMTFGNVISSGCPFGQQFDWGSFFFWINGSSMNLFENSSVATLDAAATYHLAVLPDECKVIFQTNGGEPTIKEEFTVKAKTGNLSLFGLPGGSYPIQMAVYGLKIGVSGAGTSDFKRDFRPALDADGIPCLYDVVTEAFFYDANGKNAEDSTKWFGCGAEKPVATGLGISVDSYFYDGLVLSVVLSRTGSKIASPVKVYYGTEYGADDPSAWEDCLELGGFAAAADTVSVVTADIPANAKYARYFCEENGWSPTVLLDELEVTYQDQVELAALRIAETNFFDVVLSLSVDSFGAAASSYDLTAVCREGANVREIPLSSDSTVLGLRQFVISGLHPSCDYSISVRAENGHPEGTAVIGPIAFETKSEDCSGPNHVALPLGAKLVSYIKSDGTQWIDTGVTPASNKTRLGIDFGQVENAGIIFGQTFNWNSYFFWINGYNMCLVESTSLAKRNAATDYHAEIVPRESGTDSAISLKAGDADPVVVNDVNVASKGEAIAVFNISGGASYYCSMALYGMQIEVDGELRADLRPAVDPHGTACLFNLVTNEFLYNANEDGNAFSVGEDVVNGCAGMDIRKIGFAGGVVKATLARAENAVSQIYFCYGTQYGGKNLENWEHVEVLSKPLIGAVGEVLTPSIPKDVKYLRFYCVESGWTETKVVSELPRLNGLLFIFR